MAFERAIDLYLNTRLTPGQVLLRAKNDPTAASPPLWISGDTLKCRLWFLTPATTTGVAPAVESVPAGSVIRFAGKVDPDDEDLLFLVETFAETGEDAGLHYLGTLDLNTTEIEAALAGATDRLEILCDVEVRNADNSERITFQFPAVLTQQAYSGDESSPTPATPAYPAAGDIALAAGTLGFLGAVTGLTGGGATNLDGAIVSAGLSVPRAFLVVLGGLPQIWILRAGTDAEDAPAGLVRPDDYAGGTNERVLERVLLLA
ncbi:hypothetical protein ASA1KI_21170 [Opitutales bacterium ASA1]|uniref:hypothetical protein n=1 Tax=Congregicoccus parvus TaxID=3081749 RepID=UPI002B2D00F0|nr:hypothetical protein ASA1KI_21170 [Opitutales bacterium ASA1]